MKNIKLSVLLLTFVLMLSACGASESDSETDAAEYEDTVEAKESTKFDNINLNGDTIRVWSSINDYDSTNAHDLIAGTGEENGDIVNDSVYKRNLAVEENLNVRLEFIPSDEDYGTALEKMRSVIMSGDDLYDIIIQDVFREAQIVMEGMALDVSQHPMLDFDQPYWMKDYMYDMSVDKEKIYIMANDFFMGALKSAHALYFNKNMMTDLYGDSDTVYQTVIDGKWTIDKLVEYIEGSYIDLDGNSAVNQGDQIGFCCQGFWGSGMPFMLSGDLKWVDYDNGELNLVLNETLAAETVEKMNKVFWNKSTITTFDDGMWVPYFNNGLSLFLGYADLNTFGQLRNNQFDVGIIPYPKLDETISRYITCTHDTSELGFIPVTTNRWDAACTVIEALAKGGNEIIMPAYYETALKVKYVSDNISAQMLDIIHDNINSSFFLAYQSYLGGNLISIFFNPVQNNSNDFASNYAKLQPKIISGLEGMLAAWEGLA